MNRKLDCEAYYERGLSSHASSQYTRSIIFSKKALTARPNYYDAHFHWGTCLVDQEAYEKSIRKHREIFCRNPLDHMAYYNLGVTFEQQNKLLEAEIQYKRSLEIDESAQEPSHNLAIVLTKQGKHTEALEQYEKNLRCDLYISSTHNSYGYLKFILGKYEEAIESFEDAIQKEQNSSLPHFNKVLALYCLGKSEVSFKRFKETIVKFVGSQGWHSRLERNLLIYVKELSRFKELLENDNLGEIPQEQLVINIKGLEFIIDKIKQEVTKPRSLDDVGL